jgi:hypothetical protein
VYTHIYLEKLHTEVSLLSIFTNLSLLTVLLLLIVNMAVARSLKFAVLGTGRMVSPTLLS